jgi:hypothetical protein
MTHTPVTTKIPDIEGFGNKVKLYLEASDRTRNKTRYKTKFTTFISRAFIQTSAKLHQGRQSYTDYLRAIAHQFSSFAITPQGGSIASRRNVLQARVQDLVLQKECQV